MLMENTCMDYIKALSSSDPIPGGGGAVALAGSIGTALGNMVGALTVNKEKFADVRDELEEYMKEAEEIQLILLKLVDKDAAAFRPLVNAYKLPASTEEEKAEKDRIMADALEMACTAPLEIMEYCCRAIEICNEFAIKGAKVALSDAGVGVILCKSALQGAALNVFINSRLMKDEKRKEELNRKAVTMLTEYTVKADTVYAKVYRYLID